MNHAPATPPLQAWASDPSTSRGRRHPEPAAPTRNPFQRDRDRIVHSTGFRRLVYKTQVFINHEGDLFRTRLTHSLEVAQIARSIARVMGLHEDLCEAIALAHDIGHTPFGHAGQDALDACLRASDPASLGFEHNFQSLRVVDALEERYPGFDGLNLCFETREGILKHCSLRRAHALEASEPGGVGRRFIEKTQPSLEAQLCNFADEIAYNTHDIDDGVRSGLIGYEQLLEVPLVERAHARTLAMHPAVTGRRLLYAALGQLLSAQVDDLVAASQSRLRDLAPLDAEAARRASALIGPSASMAAATAELKSFLRERLYRHPRVAESTDAARRVVRGLFEAYCNDPQQLPDEYAARSPLVPTVVDYLAGMTDRFAVREHARLFGPGSVHFPSF